MPEIGLFGSEGGAPTLGVPTPIGGRGKRTVPVCSVFEEAKRDASLTPDSTRFAPLRSLLSATFCEPLPKQSGDASPTARFDAVRTVALSSLRDLM